MPEVQRSRSFKVLFPLGFGFVLFLFGCVALALKGSWGAVVFGVIAVAFAGGILVSPFEVTVGPGNLLTFRALTRRESVHAEDVRRIERSHGETGIRWKVFFVGGSRQISGDDGWFLAQRLCELNPSITTNFDPFSPFSDEGS
jgi:hypothetical protein